MTKAKIAKINKLVAAHNPAWRAHGYWVILKQDEWLPTLLTAGGSPSDKDWYKALGQVIPMFAGFGKYLSASYYVGIDARDAFRVGVETFDEVAKRVAETVDATIGRLAPLTPLESFRKNAYDWWASTGSFRSGTRYPTDSRLEQDLAYSACAAGDLEKARYHCEHAIEVLKQIAAEPFRFVQLEAMICAIDAGADSALELVRSIRAESCQAAGISIELLTGQRD